MMRCSVPRTAGVLVLIICPILFDPTSPGVAQTHPPSYSAYDLTHELSHRRVIQDSLDLRLLELEIARAEVQVGETDLWHRLIPQVHVSASASMRNYVFIDPATYDFYLMPRDSYRLTIALSVTDIFDFSKNHLAQLQLEKLQAEHARLRNRQLVDHLMASRKSGFLNYELLILHKEQLLVEKVAEYKQMLFERGQINYDAVVRSEIDVLNIKRRTHSLMRELEEQSGNFVRSLNESLRDTDLGP